MITAAAHGPSTLWYATRGTGAMTLVLLTASVVLGISEVRRWRLAAASRLVVASMHRTISLLAVALLAVHIVTTVLDPFPRIGLVNAVVPFATSYRPLWMGLGTIASDLLVALVLTSLVRRRLGYRAWVRVHWLAYACWPVAMLHGAGTGSDMKATWMLALTVACAVAVLTAAGARLLGPGTPRPVRTGGIAAAALATIAFAVWLPRGPLGDGWARRAGTPRSVLAAFSPPRAVRAPRAAPLTRPFVAALAGNLREGTSASGMAVVDLRMRLSGGPPGVLRIRLGGQAVAGGGLRMDRSAVTLGPPGRPAEFRGRIETLNDNVMRAVVGDTGGRAVRLEVGVRLGGSSVTGQVRGTPVAG